MRLLNTFTVLAMALVATNAAPQPVHLKRGLVVEAHSAFTSPTPTPTATWDATQSGGGDSHATLTATATAISGTATALSGSGAVGTGVSGGVSGGVIGGASGTGAPNATATGSSGTILNANPAPNVWAPLVGTSAFLAAIALLAFGVRHFNKDKELEARRQREADAEAQAEQNRAVNNDPNQSANIDQPRDYPQSNYVDGPYQPDTHYPPQNNTHDLERLDRPNVVHSTANHVSPRINESINQSEGINSVPSSYRPPVVPSLAILNHGESTAVSRNFIPGVKEERLA